MLVNIQLIAYAGASGGHCLIALTQHIEVKNITGAAGLITVRTYLLGYAQKRVQQPLLHRGSQH